MNKKFRIILLVIFSAFILNSFFTNRIVSPIFRQSSHNETVMNTVILPLLKKNKNTYFLKKETAFVSKANASYASSNLYDNSSSYAVVDFNSGKVIMDKNLDEKLPIASLTKLMTAVVVLDLASDGEYFTVTKKAANQIPTKIGVIENQKMSVNELLHALLMTSANDSAEVLKDGINNKYEEKVFIQAMNEKAKLIGLKNTSFENPQGFDSNLNYSTSHDLAILSYYALKNYPLIADIVAKEYVFLPEDSYHKQFDLYNWNGLIGVYPNTIGIKIGSTENAGKTTIVVSEREGKKLLAVILGAPGVYERDLWASQLLDAGFLREFNLQPIEITRNQLQKKYDSWY